MLVERWWWRLIKINEWNEHEKVLTNIEIMRISHLAQLLSLWLILPYGCMYCWLILKSHRAGISGLRQHKALIIQRYQGKCVSIYKKRKLIKLNDDADDDVVVAKLGRHANKLKFFSIVEVFRRQHTAPKRLHFHSPLFSSWINIIKWA